MKVVVPNIRDIVPSCNSLVLDTETLSIQEVQREQAVGLQMSLTGVRENSGRLTEFIRSSKSNSFSAVIDRHELSIAIAADGVYIGNRRVYRTRGIKKYSVSYIFAYKDYIVVRFSGSDGIMSLATQYSDIDGRWLCKSIWTDGEEEVGTLLTEAIDTWGSW